MKNTNKNVSSKLLLFAAAIALCFFAAEKALAVEETGVKENSNIEKSADGGGILIADVNIRNAEIRESEKGIFEINFDLENSMDVQSNLVYGLELIKKMPEDEVVFADSKTYYNDKITIRKNEIIKKAITYKAPDFLGGDFELWIKVKDQSGLVLALSVFEINLSGTGQYVEFGNPCYLTVEGEGEKKYSLNHGVDLKKDEKLFFECQASNALDEAITLAPNFEFYVRDYFGEKLSAQPDENQKISFAGKENKLVKIQIPLPEKPQAYDVKISLNQEQKIFSNPIFAHFVVAGASAAIVSASLDKNSYNNGDTAIISAILSPSADNFSGARNSKTVLNDTIIDVTFKDANGNSCAEKYQYNWTKNSYPTPNVKLEVPITRDCFEPSVSLKMLENGVLLYEKNINLKPKEKVAEKQNENITTGAVNKTTKIILTVVLVALFIFVLGLILWKLRSRGKIISIFIFFALLTIASAFPSSRAHAVTRLLTGYTAWMDSGYANLVGSDNAVPLRACDEAYGTNYRNLPLCGVFGPPPFPGAPPLNPNNPMFWQILNSQRPCLSPPDLNSDPPKEPIVFLSDGGSYNCYQDAVNFTFNLNKTSYTQGEQAIVTASTTNANTCNNGVTLGLLVKPSNISSWQEVIGLSYFNKQKNPSGYTTFSTAGLPPGPHRAWFYFHFYHGTDTSGTDSVGMWWIDYYVAPGSPCTDPWGNTIKSGQSITAFTSPTGPTCGAQCSQTTFQCVNGAWQINGKPATPYASCSNLTCTNVLTLGCMENGASFDDAFLSSSANGCTESCKTETRVCTNGILSGSAKYATCTEVPRTYSNYSCLYSNSVDCNEIENCEKTNIRTAVRCLARNNCGGTEVRLPSTDSVCAAKLSDCSQQSESCPACPLEPSGWKEVAPN